MRTKQYTYAIFYKEYISISQMHYNIKIGEGESDMKRGFLGGLRSGNMVRILFLLSCSLLTLIVLSRYSDSILALQQHRTYPQEIWEQSSTKLQEPPLQPRDLFIVLDPGHGGKDEGCIYEDIYEKDLTLSICKKLKSVLEKRNFRVRMTRDTDIFLPLNERADFGNEVDVMLLICLHINAMDEPLMPEIKGVECFYNPQANPQSGLLAENLHKAVLKRTGAKARQVLEDDYFRVIKRAQSPSCLFECGFLTNEQERRNLTSQQYQQKLAEGLADGVERFYRRAERELLNQMRFRHMAQALSP